MDTLVFGVPLIKLFATVVGCALGWMLTAFAKSLANGSCFFGHRGKKYIAVQRLTNWKCPEGGHPVHDNSAMWATAAKWWCSFCDSHGEECLGEHYCWKVKDGKLETCDRNPEEKTPLEAVRSREIAEAKKSRWLTHEEAYNLIRELVEAARTEKKA